MLPKFKQEYIETGKVELIFLDYPLNIHADAMAAAVAAGCAHEQGKFWAFHDALFEVAPYFDRADFPSYAEKLGLDTAEFSECWTKERTKAAVRQDIREGRFAGVRGTPFFVLGRRVPGKDKVEILEALGSVSYESLVQRTEHWLQQQ